MSSRTSPFRRPIKTPAKRLQKKEEMIERLTTDPRWGPVFVQTTAQRACVLGCQAVDLLARLLLA